MSRSILALLPSLLFAVLAFDRRWMNEDAFINLRIAENVLDGHGLVYNSGERVEAGTSPLWILMVALLGLLGIRLEHAAVYGGWVLSVGALLLAQSSALLQHGRGRSVLHALRWRLFVPLGVGVFCVLPAAWDHAASGLETGLALSWLAASYLLVVRLAVREPRDGPTGAYAWYTSAALLGIGPLIRPELSLYTLGFLLVLSMGRWQTLPPPSGRRARGLGLLLLSALMLPVFYQTFRMGYFAVLVPNTALAKEAMSANWAQGYRYAKNFFGLYHLIVPLALVVPMWLPSAHDAWRGRRLLLLLAVLAPVACGLLHGLYVIRLGGDFMHGRMFLPVVFALLLPGSMVPLRKEDGSKLSTAARLAVSSTVLGWMVLCGVWLRVDRENVNGIGDERGWHARIAGTPNPVTLEDYTRFPFHRQGRRLLKSAARRCKGGRLPRRAGEPNDCVRTLHVPRSFQGVPLVTDTHPLGGAASPQAVMATSLAAVGMTAYLLGSAFHVVDIRGLADPFAARLQLGKRGRPGHEKRLDDSWVVARFSDYAVGEPAKVTAARDALKCGALAELQAAVSEPLTLGRFFGNLRLSWQLTMLRFSPEPTAARQKLCGTPPAYHALAGGPGGTLRTWHCPIGFALDQLSGSVSQSDESVSEIVPVCRRIHLHGTAAAVGRSRSVGPRFGRARGTRFTLRCPEGQLPVGFFGRSKGLVSRVGLVCAEVRQTGGRVRTGPASRHRQAGQAEGREFELVCPKGDLVVGVTGRAGEAVDAIGIVCGSWERPR